MTDTVPNPGHDNLHKPPVLRTGIPSLDVLLGGEGIPGGTIVLVRGGPGSGKTTLCLQILEHHLSQGGGAGFVSLESPPDEVLSRARRTFFHTLPASTATHLNCLDRKLFEKAFFGDMDLTIRRDRLRDCLSSAMRVGDASGKPSLPLLVIDSLNILVDILTERFDGSERRTMLHTVCKAIQDLNGPSTPGAPAYRPVVMLTAEYHASDSPQASLLGESFLCDVEILLTSEEFGGPQPDSSQKGHVEPHSFCRVTKSRSSPNQKRRSCYEIVDGKGLVFYDSYPGDGRILLFHENAPQRLTVTEFFKLDVPQLFPTLHCASFDRDTLHHILNSQRRFHGIPEGTDLYLASFDGYWVNWYVEHWQRMQISRILKDKVPSHSSELVGAVHRAVLEGRWRDKPSVLERCGGLCATAPDHEVRLREAFEEAEAFVYSHPGQQGIFELLDWEELRLFATRRSSLVEELDHGTHLVQSGPRLEGEGVPDASSAFSRQKVRSLPYNLNVGLFVCRSELIETRSKRLAEDGVAVDDRLRETIMGICRYRELWVTGSEDPQTLGHVSEQVAAITRWRHEHKGEMPSWTWEEVIAYAEVFNCEILADTHLFDTFLALLLELVWAHGGNLVIHADYSIEAWEETRIALLRAFSLLTYMFRKKLLCPIARTPVQSMEGRTSEPSWLFARHWYSTLVDTLTARASDAPSGPFSWDPEDSSRLQVLPIPTTGTQSFSNRPIHYSCLGEWHFGLVKGSENKDLAYSLLNWLMSSQAIGEQALRSAVLPTAQSFYEIYGSAQCLNVPERAPDGLPKLTFNEARQLAANSRSRSSIFDYRRTMRELHGILEAVRTGRLTRPEQLGQMLDDAKFRIQRLGLIEPTPV